MRLRLHAAVLAAILALPLAARAEKINVSAIRLSSSGPLFIAQDKGFFAAEGLEVEFKFFTAAQPVAVAVASGDADLGVTGLTAGFYNLAGKGALKIVAAQSRDEPGYQLVAYLASTKAFEGGLDRPAKLAGRTIAITQVGSTFHYYVGLLAEKHKFDLAGVKLVALQSIPNMMSALKGGQVDAVLAPSVPAIAAVKAGDARLLGWAGDETPWQLGALFASSKLVAEKRAVVERFVRAYQKGTRAYAEAFPSRDADGNAVPGKDYEAALEIIAKYVQQPPERVRGGLAYMDADARLKVADIHRQVAWWQSQGQVDKSVVARDILDLGFVAGHFDVPK